MVRPSSCIVKGGVPSSRRYLPTYLYLFCLGDWQLAPECSELHLWARGIRSSLDWLKYGYPLQGFCKAYDYAVCCTQCRVVSEWPCEDMSLDKARLLRRAELERRAPLWPSKTATFPAGALGVTMAVVWRVWRLAQCLTRLAPLMMTLMQQLLSLAPLVGTLVQCMLLKLIAGGHARHTPWYRRPG